MRPRNRLELVIVLMVVAITCVVMWGLLIRLFDPTSNHPRVTITYTQQRPAR